MDKKGEVAIIGAGLTGLVLALRLSQAGTPVTLFEREPIPGGLSASFSCDSHPLERFYHHLFPGHQEMIALIHELGLEDDLFFRPAPMATFSSGQLYPFSSPVDLLFYPPLPVLSRLRTGAALASLLLQKGWKPFDRQTASALLLRRCGAKSYQLLWEPLLRQKYGEMASEVSAAWLWDRLNSRARPAPGRPSGSLGYLKGGFEGLFAALVREVVRHGGQLRLGCPVERLERDGSAVFVHLPSGRERFQRVVATLPLPHLIPLMPGMDPAYRNALQAIPHAHSLCLVLRLKQSLSPYYWINLADRRSPFAVCVEHTRLAEPQTYDGAHILYLSCYLNTTTHPLWQASNEALTGLALPLLQQLKGSFSSCDILSAQCFRATCSQPVFRQGYARQAPDCTTPWPGLSLLNSSQFYPQSRCLNTSIHRVNHALEHIPGLAQP